MIVASLMPVATVAPLSHGQRASSAWTALDAACGEMKRLRALELGPELRTPIAALGVEPTRELFRRAEAFGFSGGLHLVTNGRAAISRGYGMAVRDRDIPMTPDTIFDVGSVSKQFTGAAILRLEEEGRLRVEDPISRFLADVPEDKRGITIHQLLTHSSGLPHDAIDQANPLPSREQAVRTILAARLTRPPGTRWAYSNAGYSLLAALVEQLSGMPFEAYLRSRFFGPLGMSRTGFVDAGLLRSVRAEGYTFEGPRPAHDPAWWNQEGPSRYMIGAGQMRSTLNDLHRWMDALSRGTILSDASRRKLFWPHVRESLREPSFYGYGWALFSAADGSCRISHDGSARIHFNYVFFSPQHRSFGTAFDTQTRSPWRGFASRALQSLFGGEYQNLPSALARPAVRRAYLGRYASTSGEIIEVAERNGHLVVPMNTAAAVRVLSPWPQLPAGEAAQLRALRDRIPQIMDEVARGNAQPMLDLLPARAAAADERQFWSEYLPRWQSAMGPYRRTSIASTVAVDGAPRTLALLQFERGVVPFAFLHEGDRLYADWIPHALPREAFLAAQADGTYLAHHPHTNRTVRLQFGMNGRTLTVDAQSFRRTEQ